ARCKLLAGVGTDKFGDEALQLWRAEGVDCSAVRHPKQRQPSSRRMLSLDCISGCLEPLGFPEITISVA
ncbi:hypothetical protein NKI30_33430, partial [Mesorhizobium opportunistum]